MVVTRLIYILFSFRCVEEPDMPYEDGALTLFLYTKGTVGIPSEEIKKLLAYMEDGSWGRATNTFLQELHGMVEHVKHDEEVSIRYMRLMEDERDLPERGRLIGFEEGIEQGIAKERTLEKIVKHFRLSIEVAETLYDKVASEQSYEACSGGIL